jgi:Ca2+/Na+ antiporter
MVFSVYSYFLPKDRRGRFLMPEPITSAGTQLLVAGAAIGLVVGLVMLSFAATGHPKQGFAPPDLLGLGTILLAIFAVYLTKLLHGYASEEDAVRTTLDLSKADVARRRARVYLHVHRSPAWLLAGLFAVGVGGALLGGHLLSAFAETALSGLGFNGTLTALVLAASAGMSEYVILWHAHRRQEYGIALANAFGGITQVMFLVLPFTLLAIGGYQLFSGTTHPELPLAFTLPNVLLLLFLFPTFFVLAELLEEDHTLGILDTTIMVAIFGLLLLLLVTYGAHPPNGSPAAGG